MNQYFANNTFTIFMILGNDFFNFAFTDRDSVRVGRETRPTFFIQI